ncbi:MAG: T9SS type A sorting domain-containing protein [Saprospirales bacterium]|nr:T9SS type A sorting domain-containing protein [Saprospirales bacterium]
MTRQFILFLAFASFIAFASFLPVNHPQALFHSEGERQAFKNRFSPDLLPDSTLMFPHSNACIGCHGFDINGFASLTAEGQDVNVYDDWSATMMANSAKDPFWRAKVSHEILINPAHSVELQTKCTSCHAPQGHYTAILRGASHYTIAEMLADTTAMDGVSCGACHMQSTDMLGSLHSGDLRFDTNRVVYGPYDIPFGAPMIQYVGFEPLFSEHINDAGICAGCHTLLTSSVDLEGNFTGETFVEQATYHEWLNSSYEANEVSCQACHIPRLEEPIVISSNYAFLDGREPFGLHEMVGANTAMLKLMKEHRDTLGITATAAAYDETIAKTLAMLQEQSVEPFLDFVESSNDTAYFSLWLYNKAGHKFPSGYPSRRAFIEFLAINEAGDTIFHSGKLDGNWEIEGLDEPFEPHYTMIRNEGEVQVFEMIPADVNGNFTTVLERAAQTLKDNRLPPQGFQTGHAVYDTTQIVGGAFADADFNWKNGLEGSGGDRLFYHIPLQGYSGNLNIQMRLHYQTMPPRWMAPMLAESTPEIDLFKGMFETADRSTVVVAEKTLEDVFVMGGTSTSQPRLPAHLISVFPNPSPEGRLQMQVEPGVRVLSVRLYDSLGRRVWSGKGLPLHIPLPGKGVFFVEVKTQRGVWTEKIIAE